MRMQCFFLLNFFHNFTWGKQKKCLFAATVQASADLQTQRHRHYNIIINNSLPGEAPFRGLMIISPVNRRAEVTPTVRVAAGRRPTIIVISALENALGLTWGLAQSEGGENGGRAISLLTSDLNPPNINKIKNKIYAQKHTVRAGTGQRLSFIFGKLPRRWRVALSATLGSLVSVSDSFC